MQTCGCAVWKFTRQEVLFNKWPHRVALKESQDKSRIVPQHLSSLQHYIHDLSSWHEQLSLRPSCSQIQSSKPALDCRRPRSISPRWTNKQATGSSDGQMSVCDVSEELRGFSVLYFVVDFLSRLRMIRWTVSVGSRRRTFLRALWTWWVFNNRFIILLFSAHLSDLNDL